jgi:hypothetical protein
VAVILSLRLLPFAAYAVLATSRLRRKALLVAAYVVFPGLAVWLGAQASIATILGGCTYYLLVSLGVNPLARLLKTRCVSRGGALVTVYFVYLLVPGLLLPQTALLLFLVVGWDLALSAYSYCVEATRPGARVAPLGECLFFMLVNPTVVYIARGKAVGRAEGSGALWRAVAGAAVLFANEAALRPVLLHLRVGGDGSTAFLGATATLIAYGVLRVCSEYAAHSGLASLQIGVMRQVGWIVPERYRFPLLATSPVDFWRRWNTYVRVWLEAYVFLPLSRQMAGVAPRYLGPPVAMLATLAASGLLHDAFQFAGRQSLAEMKTTMFLAAGILLVLWRLAASIGATMRRRLARSQGRLLDLVGALSSRLALGGFLVATAIVWG